LIIPRARRGTIFVKKGGQSKRKIADIPLVFWVPIIAASKQVMIALVVVSLTACRRVTYDLKYVLGLMKI
jgi:hypothetical protein